MLNVPVHHNVYQIQIVLHHIPEHLHNVYVTLDITIQLLKLHVVYLFFLMLFEITIYTINSKFLIY